MCHQRTVSLGVIWEIILMPADAIVFSIPLSSRSQPSLQPPAEEKQRGLTVLVDISSSTLLSALSQATQMKVFMSYLFRNLRAGRWEEGVSGGPCPSSVFSDVGRPPRGRLLDTVCLQGCGLGTGVAGFDVVPNK